MFVIITFYEMWHILSDDKNIITLPIQTGTMMIRKRAIYQRRTSAQHSDNEILDELLLTHSVTILWEFRSN